MPGPPPAAADWIEAANVFIWPVLAVLAITLLFTTEGGRQLRRQIQRLTFGGFEVELTPGEAAATKTEVEGRLEGYAKALKAEYARLVHLYEVDARLQAVYDTSRELVTEDGLESFRATVHVADALYEEAFYQLLDYVPDGTGAGRRYSMRFGILGLAWRMQKSLEETEVSVDPMKLVSEWGMTRSEAERAGRYRQSLACVMLWDDNGSRLGVLYLDAKPEGAFEEGFAERVEHMVEVTQLTSAVKQVRSDIAASGPALKIYGVA